MLLGVTSKQIHYIERAVFAPMQLPKETHVRTEGIHAQMQMSIGATSTTLHDRCAPRHCCIAAKDHSMPVHDRHVPSRHVYISAR